MVRLVIRVLAPGHAGPPAESCAGRASWKASRTITQPPGNGGCSNGRTNLTDGHGHRNRRGRAFDRSGARTAAVLGLFFVWLEDEGEVPPGFNPARKIELFPEQGKERYLTTEEFARLGAAIREAETIGIQWRPTDLV